MHFPRVRLLAFAVVLAGCQPGIGDECETSVDCSSSGDRLCDITQPGGYCTIFNCEPGDCPEDSVCVLFSANRSSVAGCQDPEGASPFQRSFCVKTCGSDDDCRSDYACEDLDAPNNPWGAALIDRGNGRVCVVPYSTMRIPDDRSNQVCTGTNEDAPVPPDGAGGAGGEGGAWSSAGAGGA